MAAGADHDAPVARTGETPAAAHLAGTVHDGTLMAAPPAVRTERVDVEQGRALELDGYLVLPDGGHAVLVEQLGLVSHQVLSPRKGSH